MAYNTVPTFSTGDTWSAANANTYWRDNFTDHETRILVTEGEIDTLQATGMFLISRTILTAVATSVTFSSIPATYRDMELIVDARGDDGTTPSSYLYMRFNNDTTAGKYNYQTSGRVYTSSIGSAFAGQDRFWVGNMLYLNALANASSACKIAIPNYSGTTFYKNFISNYGFIGHASDTSEFEVGSNYGTFESTAAISQIDLFPVAGNFIAGSVFSLYGII